MKRRETYHHGDLRSALVTAAIRHIAARGTENLSLRALAREIGVSPTASYRHFESRTALLAALATEGFESLARRMTAARTAADPYGRLVDIGVAYVEYARSDPVRYQLMFGAVLDDFSPFVALHRAAGAAYAVLDDTVADGIAAGALAPGPRAEICAAAWSAVHGIAGLVINQAGRAAGSAAGPAALAEPALQAVATLAADPRRTLTRLLAGLRRVRPGSGPGLARA